MRVGFEQTLREWLELELADLAVDFDHPRETITITTARTCPEARLLGRSPAEETLESFVDGYHL